MATLPAYYVDSVRLLSSNTVYIRGNTVSNLTGGAVAGFNIHNCNDLRIKNNKAIKIRSLLNTAYGYNIYDNVDVLMLYNVVSRTNTGVNFDHLTTLNVYNFTGHNCNRVVYTNCNGTFRNISLSAYEDYGFYRNCNGFYITDTHTSDIDYLLYFGLLSLIEYGSTTLGSNINEKQILYFDEPNDDLTPDHISELIDSGTANPILATGVDVGGIESSITDETTAEKNYYYELLDNSFWDVTNPKAGEVSFIKTFQSRVLANSENAERTVERNMYIKTMESPTRFSELFPMANPYVSNSKFRKRVGDLWYSTQNPATLQAMQNSIGGYNLFPSFFKRLEDVDDAWIIAQSYIDVDNWLMGYAGLKYGIVVDVLGVSTMNQATSGECYNNTQYCVSDIATVLWALHDEIQPSGYIMFTDLWNGFENCVLENALYDDDFTIYPDVVPGSSTITTPLIRTDTIATSGNVVEVSLLDRQYSENIIKTIYYREGNASTAMGSWIELKYPIGGYFIKAATYVQFKISAKYVLRRTDYEFMGICLRKYTSARDWSLISGVPEVPFI